MIHQRTVLSGVLLLFLAPAVPGPAQSQSCPTPAAEVLIFANPSVLSLYEKSRITVIARRDQGCSPVAFERVLLVAEGGELSDEQVLLDADGEAQSMFIAWSRPGFASVTALMPGAEPVSVAVEILRGVDELWLQAAPQRISRWHATINLAVLVVDTVAEPIAGQIVVIQSLDGLFWERVRSDTRGHASVTVTLEWENLAWIDRFLTVEASTFVEGFHISDIVEIELLD